MGLEYHSGVRANFPGDLSTYLNQIEDYRNEALSRSSNISGWTVY
jgi:hypothetical protein